MSTQNLISLTLSPDQLNAFDGALTSMEAATSGFISLSGDKRKTAAKMGPKSEVFCRQTLTALVQNPRIVPATVDLASAQADLATFDQLMPRLQRLLQITERVQDTQFALGSDVMATALQGYKLLKVAGRSQGLEGLREALGGRFSKSGRKPVEEKTAT